jgi:hypothetical protein
VTAVSEQMYGIICQYCGNCMADKKCQADVPYYCCSIDCRYFTEEKVERPSKKKRSHSMEWIMKKPWWRPFRGNDENRYEFSIPAGETTSDIKNQYQQNHQVCEHPDYAARI